MIGPPVSLPEVHLDADRRLREADPLISGLALWRVHTCLQDGERLGHRFERELAFARADVTALDRWRATTGQVARHQRLLIHGLGADDERSMLLRTLGLEMSRGVTINRLVTYLNARSKPPSEAPAVLP